MNCSVGYNAINDPQNGIDDSGKTCGICGENPNVGICYMCWALVCQRCSHERGESLHECEYCNPTKDEFLPEVDQCLVDAETMAR